MQKHPLRLAVLVGSTRQGRFAPTVSTWIATYAARRDDVLVDTIDLADFRLPMVLGDEPNDELVTLSQRLTMAEAFIVVTPEYNHSFPASLKEAIDWTNAEWQAKPVGFVSYGGVSGGLRAVEQLRQVFAELHAVTVRSSVSFHGASTQFDSSGRPINSQQCERAADSMLNQLAWWGTTLREARIAHPYAA